MGTGNACAEHNKEIIESTSRSKRLLLESDEKTGALKPTGSGEKNGGIFKVLEKEF